jgi:CBS domain-containing protein
MDQLSTENVVDFTGRYASWEKYITKCQARDIFTPIKNVVKVNTSDSIKTVLAAMFSYKLKCFPVYDIDTDKYRAFVDVFDIVAYIVSVIEKVKTQHNIKLPKDTNQIIISRELAELDIPIGEAMNFGQENFLFMLPEETLLREVLYVMGPGAKHRIWIYNEAKNMGAGLITQTKLLQTLEEDLLHFPDIGKRTIESLGLANPTQIISISKDKRVSDAFKLLTSSHVQALAILNEEGHLENEFSSNDVKALALFGDFFDNWDMKINDYFNKLHQYCSRPRNPPVCSKNDSITHVMHLLTSHRAHHLFVVEDDPQAEMPRGLPLGLGLGPDLGLGGSDLGLGMPAIQEINGYEVGNVLLGCGVRGYESRKPLSVVSLGDIIRSLWQFCDQ